MARTATFQTIWWETALAMNAAAVTIILRNAKISMALMAGDISGGVETRSMVDEKVKAVGDGYLALMMSLPALASSTMWGSANPWRNVVTAGHVFARPGMRKARATLPCR